MREKDSIKIVCTFTVRHGNCLWRVRYKLPAEQVEANYFDAVWAAMVADLPITDHALALAAGRSRRRLGALREMAEALCLANGRERASGVLWPSNGEREEETE